MADGPFTRRVVALPQRQGLGFTQHGDGHAQHHDYVVDPNQKVGVSRVTVNGVVVQWRRRLARARALVTPYTAAITVCRATHVVLPKHAEER